MHDKYLGDSYDLVKRFWREQLACVAPLYAHSQFVPDTLWNRFTTLTTIPVLDLRPPRKARKRASKRAEAAPAPAAEPANELPPPPFGLFLDPHTGIPLLDDAKTKVSISHATLPFIVEENARLKPAYMVCFDQSKHRKHKRGLDEDAQRAAKRDYLRSAGVASFYYLSHAPFLFMAQGVDTLRAIRAHLIALGIPEQTPAGVRLQAIQD
jgi:hypothetical protein